jgi:peptide/nickel transport system permease protein
VGDKLPHWIGASIMIAVAWIVVLRPAPPFQPTLGPWRAAFRRFRARRTARVGLAVLLAIGAVTLFSPILAPYPPDFQHDSVGLATTPPSTTFLLGTDAVSRDVFSRVLHGARLSLAVALLAVIVSMTVGTAYGAIAGFIGGRGDAFMMRIIDALLSIPRILLLIVVSVLWQRLSVTALIALIGLTGWFTVSRVVRAQVLSLATRDFVLSARALGVGAPRLLFRHILPNALSPVIVASTLAVGNVIILEAGLSYLGVGIQPPTASWGSIIKDGVDAIYTGWWIAVFPGLAIVATVMALNAVGEGLRDALDARDPT